MMSREEKVSNIARVLRGRGRINKNDIEEKVPGKKDSHEKSSPPTAIIPEEVPQRSSSEGTVSLRQNLPDIPIWRPNNLANEDLPVQNNLEPAALPLCIQNELGTTERDETNSTEIHYQSNEKKLRSPNFKNVMKESSDTKILLDESATNKEPDQNRICDSKKGNRHSSYEDVNTEITWTKPKSVVSKKGTSGSEITLVANYFQFVNQTNWCLYQYRVDFFPEEERTMVKKKIMESFRNILGEGYIFDGTILFSKNLLPENKLLHCQKLNSDKRYEITLRLVRDMTPGDRHYIQFYNLLIRRCLGHFNLHLVGRHYFDPEAPVSRMTIAHKLQIWPGYKTSIRQHENEVLMCADIAHKVMRSDTVLDQLTECLSRYPNDFKRVFKQSLLGAIVLAEYNNKTYRIDDVDFNTTPMSTFELNDEVSITYMEYYNKRYDITIMHKNQPMLVSMPKQKDQRRGITRRLYLVPELCRMTGLNDEMRKDFSLMKSLADHTRLRPLQRIERLVGFSARLQGEEKAKADLERWNMKLAEGLVKFTGRVLKQEKVIQGRRYGKGVVYYSGKNADWTRELRNNPMLIPGQINNWVVICPREFFRDVQIFIKNVLTTARGMDFLLPDPIEFPIDGSHVLCYVEAVTALQKGQKPTIVMIVLPNSRADTYATIKRICTVDYGIPSQLIQAKNLNTSNIASIATKVAIQLNCKIGGAPWTVEIPMEGIMVVGFDVYHDTNEKGKSIGALVSSWDRSLTRYFSTVSFHQDGTELSNEFSMNLLKALQSYAAHNDGKLPQRIVIYRDGVGEGQITYVIQHEVELLKKKLNETYPGGDYRMAFIIITKRINTRFFADGENPPSGTIVDDVITLPHRYDFFLISQSVKHGTVSPTSYDVIHDNLGLTPDRLQRLTYKLTHLYFNWSGTIRVPAPCQCAHKLAYLVGSALQKSPNPDLNELLHFL